MWLCATVCQCLSASLEYALMPMKMALDKVLSVPVNPREEQNPVYYFSKLVLPQRPLHLILYKTRFFKFAFSCLY